MDSFQEILNIKLLHEYYEDGQCKFFQLSPDSETQQWISQQGLKFIQTKNIGRLFVPNSFSLQNILSETPDFQIRFNGTSSTPTFVNFTEFPINQLGVLVFENDNEEKNEEGRIDLAPSFKEENNPGQSVVLVSIDLKNVESDQGKWPVNYDIKFKSRVTTWKYFIINNSQEEGIQFGLSGNRSELFKAPVSTVLPNNLKAELFDSGSNLIAFKQGNSIDLNLIKINPNNKNTGNETLIAHLPNANPETLQSSLVDGIQEVYSPIYVYV